MALPARDDEFRRFLRLLTEHPEWQAELRRHVLTDELLRLPETVARLVQAHERAEARLAGVETRLAGVEDRLARLEAIVEQLVAAQVQAEQRLTQLEAVQVRSERRLERLAQQVGSLAESVGGETELEGERVLLTHLKGQGYRVLARPRPLALNGEVDTVVPVEREGVRLSVLLSAKTRLRRGDVWGWQRRLRSDLLERLRASGVEPPLLVYAYGRRVYDDAVAAGREAGIGVLDPYGEVVAPAVRSA